MRRVRLVVQIVLERDDRGSNSNRGQNEQREDDSVARSACLAVCVLRAPVWRRVAARMGEECVACSLLRVCLLCSADSECRLLTCVGLLSSMLIITAADAAIVAASRGGGGGGR